MLQLVMPTPPETRKCDNCGNNFEVNPTRRPTKGKNQQHRFCKTECRMNFHKTGTSYPQVKNQIAQMISAELNMRTAEMKTMGEMYEWMQAMSKLADRLERKLRRIQARSAN